MKKYIEREAAVDKLIPICKSASFRNRNVLSTARKCLEAIEAIPPADVVPVVRCRECVMWDKYENTAGCGYCRNKRFIFRYGGAVGSNEWEFKPITEPEFSCSDGERKGEGHENN